MASKRKAWAIWKADPALILGLISTGIYYSIILQPAMHETMLAKYTAEHSVEYVIVTLFFWGMIDIVMKLMSFPREYIAARYDWLPAREGRESPTKAAELLASVKSQPAWLLASNAGRRIVDALEFVVEKGSADDYREHIEHLADRDDQEMQAKYTVLRFVIAVTPILGFLGTVVHFGAAIGGFSFQDMDTKLPEIVAGMGTAFNTTSVALATAMTMMFALFLCERVEQSIVASIDRLLDRQLLHRFENKDMNVVPFLAAIQDANREVMEMMTTTMRGQVQVWTQGLDNLFAHFEERQRQALSREQAEFDALRQRQDEFELAREERLRQMVASIEAVQENHLAQIQTALDRATEFRQDISVLISTLNSIGRGEGELIHLQASLTDNLRALHESGQIDSALHDLTAAIHLLTSRRGSYIPPDSAAA